MRHPPPERFDFEVGEKADPSLFHPNNGKSGRRRGPRLAQDDTYKGVIKISSRALPSQSVAVLAAVV
jgi:hypothetical protein